MASVQVRCSPGFPLGGGFPAEQFLLRRYSFLLCKNKMCKTTADQHPRGAPCISRIQKKGEKTVS
jgi:hypothetical protein